MRRSQAVISTIRRDPDAAARWMSGLIGTAGGKDNMEIITEIIAFQLVTHGKYLHCIVVVSTQTKENQHVQNS